MGENEKNRIYPNYYAYELRVNDRQLVNAQKNHFFSCINKIYRESYKFIYRGDKKDKLQSIYNVDGNQFHNNFHNPLFMMGAKANMLIGQHLTHVNEINIAEADDKVFRLIFKMLGTLLRREFPFGATRTAMRHFREDEKEITIFFRQQENEQVFIDRINTLSPKQQIIVRDYYLALLHHISKSEYYTASFLLSTTSNFNVAHKFSWNGESENSDNPIIFFGWVLKRYEGILNAPDSKILKRKIDMSLYHLPVYERSFFHYQEEVTLKGGLLPHHMLGYLYYHNNREIFSINPALFDTDDSWNGVELPIDQSTFHQRIRDTLFGRYFTVSCEHNQFNQFFT